MMDCIYRMRRDFLQDEEGTSYDAYGIEALSPSGEILKSIPDVFLEKERAESLIARCNESELSLIHLMDVMEDEIP